MPIPMHFFGNAPNLEIKISSLLTPILTEISAADSRCFEVKAAFAPAKK